MLTWMGNEVEANKDAVVEVGNNRSVESEVDTTAPTEAIKQIVSPPKAAKILKV